ncbi:hypothetical protein Tco_0825200 [Tanacetum coccineum]
MVGGASGSNNEVLINGLDASNPLRLQTNASNPLRLQARNKRGFVDGSCAKSAYVSSVPLTDQWERCNVVVLYRLLSSISEDLYLSQVYSENAAEEWKELKETYDKLDGSILEFEILTKHTPWSCDAKAELGKHNQLMKLMQFLIEESHRGLGSSSGVQKPQVPFNKTMNRNKLVEQISVAKKPDRQIPKGHRFSIKKTSTVHEKTNTPRSCLRWQQTGKNFKTVGLRWVPTGKIFTSSTTKVDSEPTNGTSFNPKKEGLRVCLELEIHDHGNEPSSLKLVPKVVPPADKTATSQQELELLFSPMYEEYFNAGNPSV